MGTDKERGDEEGKDRWKMGKERLERDRGLGDDREKLREET